VEHLHWKSGSAKVKIRDNVTVGKQLAITGDSGMAMGNIHHHTVLVYFPDGAEPPDSDDKHTVSVPAAFMNYFLLERTTDSRGLGHDEWQFIEAGVPSQSQIVSAGLLADLKKLDIPLVKQELIRFRDFMQRSKSASPLRD